MHALPIREAPGAQSASPKGVSGVGSTHSVMVPPEQSVHAGLHAAHVPWLVGYSPVAHLEMHWPVCERSGKTSPSGQPPLVAHLFHLQPVHSVAAGPEHDSHVGSHAWQTRAASA